MHANIAVTDKGLTITLNAADVRKLGISGLTEIDISTDGDAVILRAPHASRHEELMRECKRMIELHGAALRKLADS
jgi:hypothetical protein